jgi:hypothetical protein
MPGLVPFTPCEDNPSEFALPDGLPIVGVVLADLCTILIYFALASALLR